MYKRQVWTYGYNGNGQLGLGDTTNRTEPTKVNIENVIDITAGYQYTAILKNDGTVWTTGYSGYGTSGIDTKPSKEFRQVPNLTDVIEISSGHNTIHVLKKDGTVWSWGLSEYGEFGNNTASSSAIITPVSYTHLITAPSKTKYEHGETKATDGTITVTFTDNTTEQRTMKANMITENDGNPLNMSPAVSDYTNNKINKTLKITYTEEGKTGTVNYPIEIINKVQTITIKGTPKTTYNVKDVYKRQTKTN